MNLKVKAKCLVAIARLADEGHRARRPLVDYLDEDIWELRIALSGNQYRILYFFYGKKAIVLTGGFLKKVNKVPLKEIRKAIECKEKYENNPVLHTYVE